MTGGIQTDESPEDRRKDRVTVGAQTDEIGEGRGRDRISVGTQTDEIEEGRGRDRISVRTQTDEIEEGRGRNRISVRTQTDEIEEGRGRDLIPVCTQTKPFDSRKAAQYIELRLLPGLHNEITLDRIVPKLPWTAIMVLGSVNRCWEKAIRRHQVYDARVRFLSTELFVVLDYKLSRHNLELALYSMRDEYFIPLPPIPYLPYLIDGILDSKCVSLDGKVYVVGGRKNPATMARLERNDSTMDNGSAEVLVLDLAGQRQWKKCASMLEGRYALGCAVLNGKIYVLGGMCSSKPVLGSEVYDPSEDTWSSIMPMERWRSHHTVATMGEELFVHGGFFLDSDYSDPDDYLELSREAYLLEIYNPTTNEWKRVGPYENEGEPSKTTTFMARGKFHRITLSGIDVYNFDENAWTILHIHSFGSIRAFRSATVIPQVAVLVNDELLLCVYWFTGDRYETGRGSLLQSKGFESENTTILWEILDNCSPSGRLTQIMCPIQL